jgi:adenine deaminase
VKSRRRALSGILVDPVAARTFGATIVISDAGFIDAVVPCADPPPVTILPGMVDAHVHVESSMLTPAVFAQAACCHGTLAAVIDPHEIANVLGRAGVEHMLAAARQTPFVFGTGVPSCVPSTPFDTGGGELSAAEVAALLHTQGVTHLAEMMNVPGVLQGDPAVLAKLEAARRAGLPIDGHAPGLTGDALRTYVAAGITTDHESVTIEEASEKIAQGMMIQIRQGSAASNRDALLPLLEQAPERCMFCSDDLHPDDLLAGHINAIAAAAYRRGISLPAIVQAASLNPIRHYRLPVGLLQPGDSADLILVDDLATFRPRQVFLRGVCICEDGRSTLPAGGLPPVNRFAAQPLHPDGLRVHARDGARIHVMQAVDGSLVTGWTVEAATVRTGCVCANPASDVLKIAVCNRYQPAPPAVAFIRGFGLRAGALAASVAHDAHNLIAVGASDTALAAALNTIIAHRGGLAVADDGGRILAELPLPIGGLMSPADAATVAAQYAACDRHVKALGAALHAPFMTLSFMALPVIPALKLTSKGLFDVGAYTRIDLLVSRS